MLLGAGLVSLCWLALHFWPADDSPGSTLATALLVALALTPTTLALTTLLSRPIRGHGLAHHNFSGPASRLTDVADINLLLLLPENLNTPNLPQRLKLLKQRGVQSIFVTPQPPATAAAIAASVGADDFWAQAAPAELLALIESSRASGWQPAMATTSEACLRPCQRVKLAVTSVTAAPILRQTAAIVDAAPGPPRLIALAELGHQWRVFYRLQRSLALLVDGLKWVGVIPAVFPALAAAIGLPHADPISTGTTALVISGITAVACGALLFFAGRRVGGNAGHQHF